MKNKIIFLLLFLTTSFSLFSQAEKREKIKSLKIAFITQELQLTSSEAEIFWPVYNEFDDKFYALRKEEHEGVNHVFKNEIHTLNEIQAASLIKKNQDLKKRKINLEDQRSNALMPKIGAVKFAKLLKAEYDFHVELLSKYKEEETKKN